MKKVKYIVGEYGFGQNAAGDVLDAYLICADGSQALLFHPRTKLDRKHGFCASISICQAANRRNTKFEEVGEWNYVNLSRREEQMFERMIENEKRREKRKKK